EMTIPMKKVESFDYPIYQQKETPVMSSELPNTPLDYGYSFRQLSINGANYLHQLGAHGEGMLMVVMDAGFHNVPTISHFDKLRNDGRLLGTRNFVQPGRTVFGSESHGTNVLSCIAAYKPGEIIGSAPLASFYLAKTEDSRSENVIEEDNWVAGVEWADSLGCDVLNSSLGYTKFDDSTKVRTYQDLNGKTSRASQAATIAATKGMIICNSAGNEGASEWHYLGSPADSKDIITVGAIDYEGKPAEFSSYGPTADGRIKPDAAAVGFQTVVCNDNGKTDVSYGTSFSSPLLSGMVACLWQLFPNKTNYQIMEVVRFCGSLHERPDSVLGYGITNFLSAHNILSQSESFKDLEVLLTYVRTSKSSVAAYAFSQNTTAYSVSVSLLKSKDIITKNYKIKPGERKKIKIKLPKLPKNESAGMAVIKVNDLTNQTSYIEYIGLTTK
ncbi:MAG: S8 family serine peptidase, partial [Bacteroidales bacterium]|nr:S8 family serine peptidase [Bacteroidales bacterium]